LAKWKKQTQSNPIKAKTNPIQTQSTKRPKMNLNTYPTRDYSNKTAFRQKQNKPNQTQFQTQLVVSLSNRFQTQSQKNFMLKTKPLSLRIKKLTITGAGANLKGRRFIWRFGCFRIWGIGTCFLGDRKMQSYIKMFVIVILTGLVSVGFTQEAGAPSFPYMAEITGDNVLIRSGPGTNFYDCGKLKSGDKVKVIGKQFSWARIVPPSGSFSWISMQYVSIDPDNPTVGTVTGDRVRVYAGSDHVKPLYSTTLQGKLDKGDKVTLLGEQMDDYYKIAPPLFAYLWVSANYTKPIPVKEVPPAVKPPIVEPKTVEPTPVETPTVETPTVEPIAEPDEIPEEVVPEPVPVETILDKYRDLVKQVEAERAKPRGQQSYTKIKEALTEIVRNKEDDNAARYAAFVLKQIEGFELALAVAKEVQLQNEQLKNIKARINKACATRLAEFQDLGRFAVVGKLQAFTVYGPGHYRIVNESGKTICYAIPGQQLSQANLKKLIGRKVGLVGTIEPHRQTAGALVRFTEVAELD
jgi:uncharacterized protein YraI